MVLISRSTVFSPTLVELAYGRGCLVPRTGSAVRGRKDAFTKTYRKALGYLFEAKERWHGNLSWMSFCNNC